MLAESISLDPQAIVPDRVELDLTSDEISPTAASGVDWGDAAVEAYLADLDRGSIPVDYRVPNRTVTIPLILKASATRTLDQVRARLQQKVGLIQREGGHLERVTAGGTTVYLDLVGASLALSGNWLQAHREVDHEATLTLEALPEFYEGEITLASQSETTDPELIFTLSGIRGDTPGRVRIVTTNGSTEDQRGLLLGIRSRHYDPAATAALAFEAEAMTPMDTAATAAGASGASGSGSNVVRHSGLTSAWWTPIVKTDLLSGGQLTHTGRYRVFARVYTATGSASVLPPSVRLAWGRGDLAQITNDAVAIPGTGGYYAVDLGVVDTGGGWTGIIQGKSSDTSGASVDVDRVWLLPVDETYAKLTAPQSHSLGLSTFALHDDFASLPDGTALGGRVAPLGGTWATSGDATDFKADNDVGAVYRATTGDTNGRLALLPGDWGAMEFGGRYLTSVWPSGQLVKLVCRYVDADNYLALEAWKYDIYAVLALHLRHAATDYWLAVLGVTTFAGTWLNAGMQVTAAGRATATVDLGVPFGNTDVYYESLYKLSGYHPQLKAGGDLDTGKAGFLDLNASASAATRYFASVYAVAATADAVMFGSQSAELATTGMTREDSTGTAYYPIGEQVGALPRLPVAGLEQRTVELILKSSRGDFGQLPDSAIDDLSAQVFYRPSWLFVAD